MSFHVDRERFASCLALSVPTLAQQHKYIYDKYSVLYVCEAEVRDV